MPESSGARRRRSWSPLPASQSAHLDLRPSTTLGEIGETFGWSQDLKGHMAITQPPCSFRPDANAPAICGAAAMIWKRCGLCKEVFSRCSDHCHQDGRDLHAAFDKHAHWQREGLTP